MTENKPSLLNLQRYFNYLKQIMVWLLDGGFYILSSISIVATILYITKILNLYPNLVASMLSILGLVIILALQIFDARDFAVHKPNTFTNWIKSFPKLIPKVLSVKSGGYLMMTGKARMRLYPRPDAIIEEKVDYLLRQVDSIQNVLENLDDRLDKVDDKTSRKLEEVKADLKQLNITVDTKLAEHIVGSYDANIFGVIITICGVVIQVFRG